MNKTKKYIFKIKTQREIESHNSIHLYSKNANNLPSLCMRSKIQSVYHLNCRIQN